MVAESWTPRAETPGLIPTLCLPSHVTVDKSTYLLKLVLSFPTSLTYKAVLRVR